MASSRRRRLVAVEDARAAVVVGHVGRRGRVRGQGGGRRGDAVSSGGGAPSEAEPRQAAHAVGASTVAGRGLGQLDRGGEQRLASLSTAPMQIPTARPSSSSRTVLPATARSMRSFSEVLHLGAAARRGLTPTASTWPPVFGAAPAAVTGSPGPSVAAWPLARVGVGCAISSTAVPDAESTMTTVACCSLPSGSDCGDLGHPGDHLGRRHELALSVTAAVVPVALELPDGITS